jgi:hypothetical protein
MKRLVALTSTLALFGAGVLVTASPAVAAPRHVGLVVRFSNGSVSAGCTTVGGNGLQVLERKHSVTLGAQQYSGFVLRIDGLGTSRPDDTHYWSYWHSNGHGGWAYSSSGASSYTPKAGTVEGWSFVNGQSNAPKPPSHTYSALCGKLDPKPKPKPSPKPSTKPGPTSSAHADLAPPPPPSTRTSSPSSRADGRASAPPARTAAPPPAPRSSRPAPRRAHPRTRTTRTGTATHKPAASPTASPTLSRTPASPVASPALRPVASTTNGAGFPAWGTVLALVVVASLGALAWILTRRRTG